MKKVIQYALLGILCQLTNTASAVDKITIKLDFIPDLEQGQQSYGVCARCHLPEAWGNADGTYPQLAGQHVNVLMKQLLDIREGKRHSSLMYPFVQQRTIGGYQELSNIVAYISTLPMNPDHAKGPWPEGHRNFREGKKIYQQYCSSCHGEDGKGDNVLTYPRLQGQHFQYMIQQLSRIKRGVRKVDPAMQAIINNLDHDQLEKAVNYVSYLKVDKSNLAKSRDWRNPDFK